MKIPFHGLWIALRSLSGRNNGTSLFERSPFGRLTGGHWTGYPIWVLLIPAAILLLFHPTPEGWLLFGSPIVLGVLFAILLRNSARRVSDQRIVDRPTLEMFDTDLAAPRSRAEQKSRAAEIYRFSMQDSITSTALLITFLFIILGRVDGTWIFLVTALAIGLLVGLLLHVRSLRRQVNPPSLTS